MPDGFKGNAPMKYLTEVSAAHEDIMGRSGQITSNAPSRRQPKLVLQRLPFEPDGASEGGAVTGYNNSSNIVTDDDEYAALAKLISLVDDDMGECLNRVALGIDEMCKTIYILPETVPRCISYAEAIKSALGEFRSLTEDALTIATTFARNTTGIR